MHVCVVICFKTSNIMLSQTLHKLLEAIYEILGKNPLRIVPIDYIRYAEALP